jgi:hypothetical protein
MASFTQPFAILAEFKLSSGSHSSPAVGVCAMEAVAWMAGEAHSDAPQCACPVLGAYTRSINDGMGDHHRPLLNPLILSLIGTRSQEHELIRAAYIAKQITRRVVPLAYDAVGLTDSAAKLRALPSDAPLSDYKAASSAASSAASWAASSAASEAASEAASWAASSAASEAARAASEAARAARAASEAARAASWAASSAASSAASEAAQAPMWSEATAILREAIALGPHNTDTLNGLPVLRKRLDAYKADVLTKAVRSN